MSKLSRSLTSTKTKWIVTFVAIILLAIAIIGVGVKLEKNVKTNNVPVSYYRVGSLDATGKYVESKGSIYTENFIDVAGMDCKLATNPSIKYKLFFYGADKSFISASAELSADYNTVPDTAKYFRVMITPNSDGKVGLLEIRKYAKQLTITVNK